MFAKIKEKCNMEFFWVCFKIGLGVLVYRGAMELLGMTLQVPLSLLLTVLTSFVGVNEEGIADPAYVTLMTNIINYVFQILVSVLSFGCGAFTLGLAMSIGKRDTNKPIYARFSHPFLAVFFIFATVAINFAAAQVNSTIITFLAPDLAMGGGTAEAYATMTGIEIVLLFVSTAIIPGIVEEFMFRGLILTNLTPYGRGMAVVTSALLFGLMHMNPQQFFYTTLMGVILGYIYVRTRSIWICIAIHIANNGIAVLQEVCYGRFDYDTATRYSSMIMASVVGLGFISVLVLLIVRSVKRRKSPEEVGCFGRISAPAMSYEERPVSREGKILLFFSSTNTIFTAWVFVSMFSVALLMILVGLIYGLVVM